MGSLEHDDGLGGGHGLGGVPFCFVWQSLKMDLAWLLLQYDNIILIRFFVLLFRWEARIKSCELPLEKHLNTNGRIDLIKTKRHAA